jgi:N-methylhydantoinase B/oxoprolinase/acetone carboxylase alpha subunit
MELTTQQKKILEVFSMYARGYGKNKVSFIIHYYEGSKPEIYDDYFTDEEGGSQLKGYDKINNLMEYFGEEFTDEVMDNMDDSGYAELHILIDCVEKEITFDFQVQVTNTTDEYYEEDIEDVDDLESIVTYMAKNNYKKATISFEGGGDSGYIDDSIYFTNGRNSVSKFDKLEDYLYSLLEDALPGWEINDGSQGTFTIDLEQGTINLTLGINTTEMESAGTLARFQF